MKIYKSRVGLAVAAALGAACLAPATSFGYSVETNPWTRSEGVPVTKPTASKAQPMSFLNADSRGDTLLFPFYTVANGSTTSFSVTNSSPTQTVLAKIRFREQLHSMDALDFLVVLSPNDKFDFRLELGANARPVMKWSDASCVIGPRDSASMTQEFKAPDGSLIQTSNQMQVGHLEVLGVADLSGTTLAANAKHANGVPAGCGELVKVFGSPTEVAKLNASGNLRDVDNVLMGSYVVSIPSKGMEGGADAVAIRDTNLANPYNNLNTPWWIDTKWHITAQSSDKCVRNTNCRSYNYAWDKNEWDHPHLGEMLNFAGFQRGMGASAVAGDWSNNPANGVQVDWIVSFPSKYAYLDYVGGAWVLLNRPKAQGWIAIDPDFNTDGVWTRVDTTDTKLPVELSVYDKEENETTTLIDVSPGDATSMSLDSETNVFTLQNETAAGPLPSVIQASGMRKTVLFHLDGAVQGWAKMNLGWLGSQDLDGIPEVCTVSTVPGTCDAGQFETRKDTPPYDAVVGLRFMSRQINKSGMNQASLTELQKIQD